LLHGIKTLIEDMPMHHPDKQRNRDLSAGLAVLEVAVAASAKLVADLEELGRTRAA